MSDPNDKQKCGTCHGLTWVTVENSFYPRTKPCPSCAHRDPDEYRYKPKMDPPVDSEQKCECPVTQIGNEPPFVQHHYYGCPKAPRGGATAPLDGSAAEVKLPVGVAAAVKEAERIRLKAAMGKILGVPELHIIDLDDYAHTLASRVAELEARNASLERDEARYAVLRASVLKAPMSAGFVNMTSESDIDAQCDQIAARVKEKSDDVRRGEP